MVVITVCAMVSVGVFFGIIFAFGFEVSWNVFMYLVLVFVSCFRVFGVIGSVV